MRTGKRFPFTQQFLRRRQRRQRAVDDLPEGGDKAFPARGAHDAQRQGKQDDHAAQRQHELLPQRLEVIGVKAGVVVIQRFFTRIFQHHIAGQGQQFDAHFAPAQQGRAHAVADAAHGDATCASAQGHDGNVEEHE